MTTLRRGGHERTRTRHFLLSARGRAKALWYRLKEWTRVAVNHYRAAAAYEQLSRLSDAGLRQRGLSRETLARDLVEAAAAHRFTEGISSITERKGRRQ